MVQGIEVYDKLRLGELGIDSCYDLANKSFVPLLLRTPYGARELLDWILQAKLCVQVGPHVKDLRDNGIRTIIELDSLDGDDLAVIARNTQIKELALIRAKAAIREDIHNIERLRAAAQKLSQYWDREEKDPIPPSG